MLKKLLICIFIVIIVAEIYYLFLVKNTEKISSETIPPESSLTKSPTPLSREKPSSDDLNLEEIKASIKHAKDGLYESATFSHVFKGKIIQIIDEPQELIKARRVEWRDPVFSLVVETDWDDWEGDPGVKQKVVLLYNEDDLQKIQVSEVRAGETVQLSLTDLQLNDQVEIIETKDLIGDWDTNTISIIIKRIP